MHPPDEQLVATYIECGDQHAFRILVERHQERIYGYLLGMVRDRDLANDLFQETFLRVIDAMQKRRGSYTQQGRWVGWVMRIARNATPDHLRSRITSLHLYSQGFVFMSSLAVGLLVDLTTVVVALAAVGIAGLVLGSISYLVFPRVRQAR